MKLGKLLEFRNASRLCITIKINIDLDRYKYISTF